MSARDHTLIEELLAVRALGGLDGDDTAVLEAAMAGHGSDCVECERLRRGFEETAGMLAFGLEPVPVDDAIADRVLESGRTDGRATTRRPNSARGVWAAVAAVAAAFVALTLVFAFVHTAEPSTVVRFAGTPGELSVAYTPGTTGALLVGDGLPDPGPGKVYAIWLIHGDAPVSVGCVTPSDGALRAALDTDVSTGSAMALTVEPAACPPAPTTTPVYEATL